MTTENVKMPTGSKSGNESNAKNTSVSLISRHKMVFSLLLVIVIIALFSFFKIWSLENNYKKDTLKMQSDYENKIDSLTMKQLMLTSNVFSWAIRGELTRENKEQVNQYFLNFIKEPGVMKVEFVDALNSKVTMSTNKKDEGTVFTDQVALMTTKTISFKNDSILNIITPVMGLNTKLGVLVIEYTVNHTN